MSNQELKEKFPWRIEIVKNSCEGLAEKLGHLQLDYFNHTDKALQNTLHKLQNSF